MIVAIGFISGREPSLQMASEFLAALGLNTAGAYALRYLVRNLVGLVPVLGWLIKGVAAYSATKALGKAAVYYFIDQRSSEEVKRKFDDDFEQ
jgi:uncharacterized protein (DUF697 family)